MVIAMMRRPPKHSLLAGSLGEDGHGELRGAIQFISPMAEIAVIAGGNSEHQDNIGGDSASNVGPAKRHKEDSHPGEMQKEKWDDRSPVVVFIINQKLCPHFDVELLPAVRDEYNLVFAIVGFRPARVFGLVGTPVRLLFAMFPNEFKNWVSGGRDAGGGWRLGLVYLGPNLPA